MKFCCTIKKPPFKGKSVILQPHSYAWQEVCACSKSLFGCVPVEMLNLLLRETETQSCRKLDTTETVVAQCGYK